MVKMDVKTKTYNLKETNFMCLDISRKLDSVTFNGNIVKRNTHFATYGDYNVLFSKSKGIYIWCLLAQGKCEIDDGTTIHVISFTKTISLPNIIVTDGVKTTTIDSGYVLSSFLINGKTEKIDKITSFDNWSVYAKNNDVSISSDENISPVPNVIHAVYNKQNTSIRVYRAFVLVPSFYTFMISVNDTDKKSDDCSVFSFISKEFSNLSNLSMGTTFKNIFINNEGSICPFGTVTRVDDTSVFAFDDDGFYSLKTDSIVSPENFSVNMSYCDSDFVVNVDVSNLKLRITYDVPDDYPVFVDLSGYNTRSITTMEDANTGSVIIIVNRYTSTHRENVSKLCISEVSGDTCDGYIMDEIYYCGVPTVPRRYKVFKDKENFILELYIDTIIMENYMLYTINNQPISGCVSDLFPSATVTVNDSSITIDDDMNYEFDPCAFEGDEAFVEISIQNKFVRITIENININDIYDWNSFECLKPLGYPSICLYKNLFIESGTNFFDMFKVKNDGTVEIFQDSITNLVLIYNSHVKMYRCDVSFLFTKRSEYMFKDYENFSYTYNIDVCRGTIYLNGDIGYLTMDETNYIVINADKIKKRTRFADGKLTDDPPVIQYTKKSIPVDIDSVDSTCTLSAVVNNLGGFISGITSDKLPNITTEIDIISSGGKIFINSIPDGKYPFWINGTKNMLVVSRGLDLQLKNVVCPKDTVLMAKDYVVSGNVASDTGIQCSIVGDNTFDVTDIVSGKNVSLNVKVYDQSSPVSIPQQSKTRTQAVTPVYFQTPQTIQYFTFSSRVVLQSSFDSFRVDPLRIDMPILVGNNDTIFKVYNNGFIVKTDIKHTKKGVNLLPIFRATTFFGESLELSVSDNTSS